ncbi:AT-hook motif nuclear-localized protein 28 [Lathyrus oleraceus]|uniref:AT-hook motif nuclear-localized protein 28 n=1 Tax=Pisum sativum TaxID=3888 RepID=UPI001FC579F2|nr:AT-hook motif nuclear-localized protein 28-like [Pisum sativum]
MAYNKSASSSFSLFSGNEFLEENSPRSESGYRIPHTNIEQHFSGGVREFSEESMEDNSWFPSRYNNQQKPPMVIMEHSAVDMENVVLEIPTGNDVVEAIINFARRHEANIDVMNGSGLVSDITLLEPDSRVPAFQLDGPFHVLSIAGVYLNPDCFTVPPQLIHDPLCTAFAIQLSGSRGQVFGGVIGGKINAANDVHISASLFKRPQFIRVVTTDGNVQCFEDDDVPTIVDGGETHPASNDQLLP